jgi:hypothetical protein
VQVGCEAGAGRTAAAVAQVAVETIMLWLKLMFFALAIDGLGTFICE